MKNVFSSLSLEKISVFYSYFIHRYIIIKYRSVSIKGKSTNYNRSYDPFSYPIFFYKRFQKLHRLNSFLMYRYTFKGKEFYIIFGFLDIKFIILAFLMFLYHSIRIAQSDSPLIFSLTNDPECHISISCMVEFRNFIHGFIVKKQILSVILGVIAL